MNLAIELNKRHSGGVCVFCRNALRGDIRTCPTCEVSVHADCTLELPCCPTIGCETPVQQFRSSSSALNPVLVDLDIKNAAFVLLRTTTGSNYFQYDFDSGQDYETLETCFKAKQQTLAARMSETVLYSSRHQRSESDYRCRMHHQVSREGQVGVYSLRIEIHPETLIGTTLIASMFLAIFLFSVFAPLYAISKSAIFQAFVTLLFLGVNGLGAYYLARFWLRDQYKGHAKKRVEQEFVHLAREILFEQKLVGSAEIHDSCGLCQNLVAGAVHKCRRCKTSFHFECLTDHKTCPNEDCKTDLGRDLIRRIRSSIHSKKLKDYSIEVLQSDLFSMDMKVVFQRPYAVIERIIPPLHQSPLLAELQQYDIRLVRGPKALDDNETTAATFRWTFPAARGLIQFGVLASMFALCPIMTLFEKHSKRNAGNTKIAFAIFFLLTAAVGITILYQAFKKSEIKNALLRALDKALK